MLGWRTLAATDSVAAAVLPQAMAQANRQDTTARRKVIATMRFTTAERAHLQEVATARSVTLSDLIRQALRTDGALPAQ